MKVMRPGPTVVGVGLGVWCEWECDGKGNNNGVGVGLGDLGCGASGSVMEKGRREGHMSNKIPLFFWFDFVLGK
jgi:hypothetical protein